MLSFAFFDGLFDELEGGFDVVVETHGEADEAFGHAHFFLNVFGNFGAGALAAVGEEGLEVAEADGEVANAFALHDFHDAAGAVGGAHVDGDHTAVAVAFVTHAVEEFVVGVFGQTGVVVFETDLFESFGKIHGVLTVFLHADVQGVEVFVDGGGAHGVEHGAEEHAGAVVDVDEAADVFSTATDGAGDTVVGAVDVFGHGVDGDVGSKLAGAKDHGSEGVVDDELGTVFVSEFAELGDVGDAEHGVVHGLCVEDLGVGVFVECTFDGLEVLHVDEGGVDTEFGQVVGHEGEGAAVGGHGADDVVARLHFVDEGAGDGGKAGAGDPGCLGAFHGSEGLAEG